MDKENDQVELYFEKGPQILFKDSPPHPRNYPSYIFPNILVSFQPWEVKLSQHY